MVFLITLPAAPVGDAEADAALPLALPLPDVESACASWSPKLVDVVADPLTVVVTTLVAVVEALQPAQDVHGALVLQLPDVQPDQLAPGQPPEAVAEPHHEVLLKDC